MAEDERDYAIEWITVGGDESFLLWSLELSDLDIFTPII